MSGPPYPAEVVVGFHPTMYTIRREMPVPFNLTLPPACVPQVADVVAAARRAVYAE